MTKEVAERFERVETNLERISDQLDQMAEQNVAFQRMVQGAFTVQQEQIAELTKNVANLERQWQAYLSTIHPKQ